MEEIKMFLWAVFQLTDDSVFTDIFHFSSNNIANAKQIKHIADHLILGKRLVKDEYHKYKYISTLDWGVPTPKALDINKEYIAWKVEKNRGGNKSYIPLLELNLDLNLWQEVGHLIKA
jgi:hypothetical protein